MPPSGLKIDFKSFFSLFFGFKAKIINLIFATFPNGVFKNLSEKFEGCFKSVSTCVQSSRCPAIFRGFDFKRFSF